MMDRNAPPVKEGEVLDVTVEAVGEKGDGIAKKDGFVIFVPNSRQGDRVKVKITRVLKSVSFSEKVGDAEPAREVESRPARSEPEEPEFVIDESKDSEDFGEEEDDEDKKE